MKVLVLATNFFSRLFQFAVWRKGPCLSSRPQEGAVCTQTSQRAVKLVQLVVLTNSAQRGVPFLRSGLQSVRELKQSLLIVNDVQVVNTGFHLWTAVLGALIACR